MTQRYLRTSDISKAVGVHPNTVRLYEEWGFLPPIPRSASGYRLFTEEHLEQMRLARLAFDTPWSGRNIRRSALALVRQAASGDLSGALAQARWDQGHFDDAENMYRSLVAHYTRVFGEAHRVTLVTRYSLAGVVKDNGRLDEAEAELRRLAAALEVPTIALLKTDTSLHYCPRGGNDRILQQPSVREAVDAIVTHPAWGEIVKSS